MNKACEPRSELGRSIVVMARTELAKSVQVATTSHVLCLWISFCESVPGGSSPRVNHDGMAVHGAAKEVSCLFQAERLEHAHLSPRSRRALEISDTLAKSAEVASGDRARVYTLSQHSVCS